MNTSEYRAQFASFNSARELARYEYHAGLRAELNEVELYDRYSDLFSKAALADLHSQLEQTPADFETQRTGLQRLLSAAQLEHIEARTRDLKNELDRCESAGRIDWVGEKIPANEVPARLARESNEARRSELAARWVDAISTCDDLRIAYRAARNESARTLGFASDFELMFDAAKVNFERLQQDAQSLLERTESVYGSALSSLMAREFPNRRTGDLNFADLPYFEALPWLASYLPAKNILRAHAETMRGMGIRLNEQRNILIDVEPRRLRKRGAACFPVSPPQDVRLAISLEGGAADFLDGLHQLGRSHHCVWCSQDVAAHHPEFIYSPDIGTSEGYGYFFRYLPLDPRWILEFMPDINQVRANRIAQDVTFHLALRVRKLCAGVESQMRARDQDQSLELLQSAYVDLHQRATSFCPRPELYLFDLQAITHAAGHLRALAFSFGLREYFRVRYGHRWWASRKAGDELVDLWSTASRYSVEELASLVGFGELNFDLLDEVINTTPAGA